MKKFLYLCGMMLLSLNMMAQIDLNDKNWDTVFIEDFSGIRSWDSHWDDTKNVPNYNPLWRCFSYSNWASGKITHREDKQANPNIRDGSGWWLGTDEMTINYVKAYQLKSDCDTDAIISTITEFNNYEYSVKRSISMGGTDGPLVIPSNSIFTMRAVESITIDGAFELPQGAEMTLMTHECPQCSMEGVVLPEYNCGMNNENE